MLFLLKFITDQKVEIDIHNMKSDEAKCYLEKFINTANGSIKEVVIIHGYISGTVLQQMVRNKLKHKKIKSKMISLNPGITTLFLV